MKNMRENNISKNLSNMKIINCILIILFLSLTSCYGPCFYIRTKETNKNGISKIHHIWKLNTKSPKPYGSYAADEKYVKNVRIVHLNDTISKRCFKSYELENLKRVFSQDTLFNKKRTLVIDPFARNVDLLQCVGLFYVHVLYKINDQYIYIPIIKLNDTIMVNGISGIEADSSTRQYIETNLLEVYDSIETKKRVDIFMEGPFSEPVRYLTPVRK